jgi:hypothetical protein
MERLRYVARARGTDPAVLVAETAEAIDSLRPEPADLVNLCRRLVDRNPTCAPMWWFCATLLADVSALDRSWELAAEIEQDRTALEVAHALAEGATVATVGYPDTAADALVRRGDLTVLAIDAGGAAHALVRRCDRADVEAHLVPPESALGAIGAADVMLVEADACSADRVVGAMGSSLAVALAATAQTPVWLVAGRGRRLPEPYRVAIERMAGCRAGGRPWESEVESFPLSHVARVAGPDGVVDAAVAIVAECPFVPELIPPDS